MASINLDIASRLDITCRKNDTFKLDMDWTDNSGTAIDLTAYTFKAEVRKNSTSSTAIITFSDSDFTKTSTGDLTMNKASADMNIKGGQYVYDLQATKSGEVKTWLAGDFVINEDVTT